MKHNSPFIQQAHHRQVAVVWIEPLTFGLAVIIANALKIEVPHLIWIFFLLFIFRLVSRYLYELHLLGRVSPSRKGSSEIQQYWGFSTTLLKDNHQQFKFEVFYFICALSFHLLTLSLVSWYLTIAHCVPFSAGHALKLTIGVCAAFLFFLGARSYFVPFLSFQLGGPFVSALFRVVLQLDIKRPFRNQALQAYSRWLVGWTGFWLIVTGVLTTQFHCDNWILLFCFSVFTAVALFRMFFKVPVG